MQLKARQIGVGLIIVTIALAILVTSYSLDVMKTSAEECSCSDGCPHASGLPMQSFFGLLLIGVLAFLSYSLIKNSYLEKQVKKELLREIQTLQEDERLIYNAIKEADGAMLQSEIVDNLKLSKVKVTRILDKLEGKKLIERRRRGMTNIIILKDK